MGSNNCLKSELEIINLLTNKLISSEDIAIIEYDVLKTSLQNLYKEIILRSKNFSIKEENVIHEEKAIDDLFFPITEKNHEEYKTINNNIPQEDPILEEIHINEEYPVFEVATEKNEEPVLAEIVEKLPNTEAIVEKTITIAEKHVGGAATIAETIIVDANKSTIADKAGKEKISNIKGFIGLNDKFYFINRLFDGDVNYYNEVIDKFNSYTSLNDAKILLQLLINKFEWNCDDDAYKKFEDIIERKF